MAKWGAFNWGAVAWAAATPAVLSLARSAGSSADTATLSVANVPQQLTLSTSAGVASDTLGLRAVPKLALQRSASTSLDGFAGLATSMILNPESSDSADSMVLTFPPQIRCTSDGFSIDTLALLTGSAAFPSVRHGRTKGTRHGESAHVRTGGSR